MTPFQSSQARHSIPIGRPLAWLLAMSAPAWLVACSGSGSDSESSGQFTISQVSVPAGSVWQINRPIEFSFSQAVDFSTVNLNTIQIQRVGGAPALGDFHGVPGDPRTVVFQPACPTLADFSDAGFLPGGERYQVSLPGADLGATSVRATNGAALRLSLGLEFSTPNGQNASDLFLDTRPGPARPVIAAGSGSSMLLSSSLVGEQEVFFEIDQGGVGVLPGGLEAPINLYSDPESRVAWLLRFDQPISPLPQNLTSERVGLEAFLDGEWQRQNVDLRLESNCVGSGAALRITPVGLLPQGRHLRLYVAQEFQDLTGESGAGAATNFATMRVASLIEGGRSLEFGDELLESYDDQSFQAVQVDLSAPEASWSDGGLQAAQAFDGTGGPGGAFDLRIAPGTEVIFDTVSSVFIGGPGFEPQFSQLAIGGRLQVRDLHIPIGSRLRVQGPNPGRIFATGNVLIEGTLSANGSNASPVFALNSPSQAEPGGAGQAGGGDGGDGSFLTSQVTLRGGNGQGPGGIAGGGGQGGESGWSNVLGDGGVSRRAAGGGGGSLGNDQRVELDDDGQIILCVDEEIYGLNGESGFPGADTATSSDGAHIPYGGRAGPQPFGLLPGTDNDFLGRMLANVRSGEGQLVRGELSDLLPGSGGGAGGDSTYVPVGTNYPPAQLFNNAHDKGAGGGGGAGAISIIALGDITLTSTARVTAIGGAGNGGENTGGTNRIGGGSGGGSGGHIVLQSAGRIDLSQATGPAPSIDARGGQGGAGASNAGGAADGEGPVLQDAKHINATAGVDNPWELEPLPCVAALQGTLVVRGAGGDGGPGLIQLHVADLEDIDYPSPGGGEAPESALRDLVQPVPHGYDPARREWQHQLLPDFGRLSMAQSSWIDLGEAAVDPLSEELGEIGFLFAGTDPATGWIQAVDGEVPSLPVLLAQGSFQLDSSDPSGRRLIVDAGPLLGGSDEVYLRNPQLLRRFELRIGTDRYFVASASYQAASQELRLSVDDDGPTLFGANGPFELRPRYFAIATNGVANRLPEESAVRIEFELLGEDPADSNLTSTSGFMPSLTSGDLGDLDPAHRLRALRYRVTFDLDVGNEGQLSLSTPRPRIDFLRLPFRF